MHAEPVTDTCLAAGRVECVATPVRPGAECDPAFLSHWLSSAAAQTWLRTRMRGIDMPGLNLRDMRQLPVPMPPLPEQQRIGRELDDITRRATELHEAFTKLLDTLPNLESRLLESFAYGAHAAAISHQTSGEAERRLSEQLLDSLRFSDEAEDLTESAEKELSQDADRAESKTEPPSAESKTEPPSAEAGVKLPRPTGHASETNPSSMSSALSRLSGEVTPEELFSESWVLPSQPSTRSTAVFAIW
jgi:Type I restriction modification DNA specificity domain